MQANDLLEKLTGACRGDASAIRLVTHLQPTGGSADKVFPPTYAGGSYHKEKRLIDGHEVTAVVLDSVQSQANRLEEVLLRAFDAGECDIPVLSVEIEGHGRITALDAPHRVSDAIFQDSLYRAEDSDEPVPFRSSAIGGRIVQARVNNATAFFEYCPTALIFGTWDSHGGEGTRSAKVQRALTSEIVGLNAVPGDRSSSRIDPLGIQKEAATIYEHPIDRWTMDPSEAVKDDKGDPKLFGKREGKKGKPASIGHGNVLPVIEKDAGGVTISEAIQTTVLSFVQLRRLRFPNQNNPSPPARDAAGRAVLAALALYAIVLQLEEGYDLRSRCFLLPKKLPQFELLGSVIPADESEEEKFTLDKTTAKQVFDQAYQRAAEAGLTWQTGLIPLTPSARLVDLVRRSDAITEEPEG